VMKHSTTWCTSVGSFGRLVCNKGRQTINKGENHVCFENE
jgi:hypothetical protein